MLNLLSEEMKKMKKRIKDEITKAEHLWNKCMVCKGKGLVILMQNTSYEYELKCERCYGKGSMLKSKKELARIIHKNKGWKDDSH